MNRRVLLGLLTTVAVAGCGVSGPGQKQAGLGLPGHDQSRARAGLAARDGRETGTKASGAASGIVLHGRPQAIEPVAGQSSGSQSASGTAAPAGSGEPLPQPISNAEVTAELAASGLSANPDEATLIPGGLALPPVNAPAAVQAVINAGNEIARLPYIWGGGHETYEDSGYDCSGSLSFILAAAGLLDQTETSGQLMSYGDPGPGKWITIYATAGHTFAIIAGLRFDTVALAETGSRWSGRAPDEPDLTSFAVRHPPGL